MKGVDIQRGIPYDVPVTLMTTKEACDYLRVSRPTLMRLVKDGEVKGRKVGGQWRFQRTDIEEAGR